ncbi:hypothetical protein [Sphingomonas aerophila]|uniref:Uncharacterized protein n=1 Tax=Sphingomonas aerophila TaxID=1344948 RepID=A0A7W9BFL0_9SPHN|nr:hypothetical protein [Sphingomonas aerophila]MBB5716262.1 hypothetical protein [Sphingomonas aerophila]
MAIEQDCANKISVLAAYDAMFAFIESWFERGGRTSEDIAQLLSTLDRSHSHDGYPADGTVWNDFMDIAYRKVEEEGGRDPLRGINPKGSRGNP